MEKTDITIIGAGLVGLAIAAELARKDKDIVLVEKHPTFGQETSSRNSEVIHAGLYYPQSSLKAKLCVEGKNLLYELCEKEDIPYKRLGKLIVACDDTELVELERLLKQGSENGVYDLKLLAKDEIRKMEPHIQAVSAIHSPSTGIIDTHQLMKYLESFAKEKGAIFAYGCEVVGIEKKQGSYQVDIRDADGEKTDLSTRVLINSAGLNSDIIAQMAGLERPEYKLVYSKGEYFRLQTEKSRLISRLIYPVPDKTHGSLGIHATPDLSGSIRLGPDAEFIERKLDYSLDEAKKEHFCDSVKKFLPFVESSHLSSDTAGIRPKLTGAEGEFRDFIIQDEEIDGFPNFINLIGIESPGLTCALAIARYIQDISKKFF